MAQRRDLESDDELCVELDDCLPHEAIPAFGVDGRLLLLWELAFTGHAERRMEERGISEVDLRSMLQRAIGYSPGTVEHRFMITTGHEGRPWVVIVGPDSEERPLVIVTAYEAQR